jgi:hypothetical protein
MRYDYEIGEAGEQWPDYYRIPSTRLAVAWHVAGWQVEADEDSEWSGYYPRTGRLVCIMVGDDAHHLFDPEDLELIDDEDVCKSCGQLGCGWC